MAANALRIAEAPNLMLDTASGRRELKFERLRMKLVPEEVCEQSTWLARGVVPEVMLLEAMRSDKYLGQSLPLSEAWRNGLCEDPRSCCQRKPHCPTHEA